MEDMHLALYLIAAMLFIYYVFNAGKGLDIVTAANFFMAFLGLSAALGGVGTGMLTDSSALIGVGGAAALVFTFSRMAKDIPLAI